MGSINEQIQALRIEVKRLKDKVKDLSVNSEESHVRPYSKVRGSRIHIGSMDLSSGLYHLDGDFNSETGMWYAYAIYHD